MENLKAFFFEEEGLGTIEIVIIIIVLIGLAMAFRTQITKFLQQLLGQFDNSDGKFNIDGDSAVPGN